MTGACAPVDGAVSDVQPARRRWRDEEGEHIDVRGLQPPQPLVAILRLVQELGDQSTAIWVHHDRDPVLLYAELAEIGWQADRVPAPPGIVLLRLQRAP